MLSQKIKADYIALEIDPGAATQCKENFTAARFTNRKECLLTDAKNFSSAEKFDVIISNPPFYENELASPDEKVNKARHDSSFLLSDLADCISRNSHQDSVAAVLVPAYRKVNLDEQMNRIGFLPAISMHVKQTPKHAPFRSMLLYKKLVGSVKDDEMLIKNEDGSYSDLFVDLLKNYYQQFA